MWTFAVIAYPISKVLDWLLGQGHTVLPLCSHAIIAWLNAHSVHSLLSCLLACSLVWQSTYTQAIRCNHPEQAVQLHGAGWQAMHSLSGCQNDVIDSSLAMYTTDVTRAWQSDHQQASKSKE